MCLISLFLAQKERDFGCLFSMGKRGRANLRKIGPPPLYCLLIVKR